LILVVAIALLCAGSQPTWATRSHYDIVSSAPFNQPEFYPVKQSPNSALYRPVADWVGRLMLPEQSPPQDWVWMQVLHAPDRSLIGKRVRLEWKPTPAVNQYLESVTRNVRFAPEIAASQNAGNLHPTRLNGRDRVGPLQAIAGARPKDDVIVTLSGAQLTAPDKVQIETEPVLETGRFYGLVKILKSVPDPAFTPADCPSGTPCPSELFQVQHYNPKTKQFDGIQETIRIPQQPRDQISVFASTPRDLEKSPAGTAGWYIYGAQDKTGRFTVQALKPRSLFQITAQQTLSTQDAAFDYLYHQNWKDTEQRRDSSQTTLINLQSNPQWQVGDRGVVMHLFGGRGGKSGEPPFAGTVPGHFAYGFARVIRDPFTQELQWDVYYHQIYGTNIEGIIPGTHSWTNYMGNLQSGWMGTRPVNDVIVKLDIVTQDYDFGGIKLSPFEELMQQLSIIAARYRIGDGTGAATITPATSCVQDSNQALFLTIQSVRAKVESNPAIQQWWSANPNHPTIQRFEQLIRLGDELSQQLTPLGIVRSDWKQNAQALAGTRPDQTQLTKAAIASWRTILPRQAQDELSFLFLQYGAKLWFLRTNQIGGINPDIYPIAPTGAFARWVLPGTDLPVVSMLFLRWMSVVRFPTLWEWVLLAGIAAIVIRPQAWLPRLRWLFVPALLEELIFRVLLIPYPRPGITWQVTIAAVALSLGLFALYSGLKKPTRLWRSRLVFATGLGIVCTVAFFLTRSMITITILHWLALIVSPDRRDWAGLEEL
jgi:predicted Abi (CAAX) family protease